MSMSEQQAKRFNAGEGSMATESPEEKLRDDAPVASETPGAENPESETIKEEKNPNSE